MADHAAAQNRDAALVAFKATFRKTARHRNRYEVFSDFVIMSACSLHNAVTFDPDREQEYLERLDGYEPEDQKRFPELLAHLIEALDPEPRDVLGPMFMDLEIANKEAGQFFTPPEVSEAMVALTMADVEEYLSAQPFLTLSEPACGAGGMVLAVVKQLIAAGHDPAKRMWVQCIDIDRTAALMCYVQLCLWNVPGEIIVGDTLRWKHREVWHTPGHHLGNWRAKLQEHWVGHSPDTPSDFDDVQVE